MNRSRPWIRTLAFYFVVFCLLASCQAADPPALSPTDGLASIKARPEFKVELVAAEPMVMDPVALDWGHDGKLWVAEMADYPLGLDDKGKPGGRIRFLEDTDGDNKYDKSTLFLDGIAYPTGVIAWKDGVIVSAAPVVFFAADRDGDGKAEYREDLYQGFTEGNQQHLVNGFERGLDNWLYLANGDSGGKIQSCKTDKSIDIRGRDLRIRPDTGDLEAQAGRTQFGRHRDDHGNWFGCSNPLPLRHYVLNDSYMGRNPHVAPPSSGNDIARVDNTQLFPISRVLSHWSGYKPPAPGTGHRFTSACSTMVYRDDLFGNDFVDNTFTCEPVHNVVHRRILIPKEFTFDSVRPNDETGVEFLASSDSWFRPTTVTTGPDGALWITDMYRLVIEHPEWIDDNEEKRLFLRAGHDRGRIYRVYPADKMPRKTRPLSKLSVQELAKQLGSANGRTRDSAQHLLIKRKDSSVQETLERMVRSAATAMGRLHALCTLDGLNLVTADVAADAIGDKHPTVIRHALRIGERFAGGSDSSRILKAAASCDDSDHQVRLQLAYTLGAFSGNIATKRLANLAIKTENKYLAAAIVSSLNEENIVAFQKMVASNRGASRRFQDAILRMAVRMKDNSFLNQMVGELLDRIDVKNLDAGHCNEAAETLADIRAQAGKPSQTLELRVHKLAAQLITVAQSGTDENKRVAAINFIGEIPQHRDQLLELVSSTEPTKVQVASVRQLAFKRTKRLISIFDTLSPAIRSTFLESMMSRESSSLEMIAAIKSGEIPASAINAANRQRLKTHYKPRIQSAANEVFNSSTSGNQRQAVLKHYRSASPVHGDAKLGQAIFKKHCSACHQIKGVGHVVGPDLAAIKNRSPKAMLTAILDPNAAVEDKYQSYNVLTSDGTAATGMIEAESGNAIVLRMQEGKTKTILRDEIDLIKSTGQSLMPVDLQKNIPLAEMNHLLAFLNELGPTPKLFDGNEPKTVSPTPDQTIELTATSCRIYGDQVVFEPKYKNVGHWGNSSDRVEWTLQVEKAGKYDVWLDYSCADHTEGNEFIFTCGDKTLRGKIEGTGTWDDYHQVNVGTVELGKDTLIAVLSSGESLKRYLFDLRSIQLKPSQ